MDHNNHSRPTPLTPTLVKKLFWLSLALTVAIGALSPTLGGQLGYQLTFAGHEYVSAALGLAVFATAGWQFVRLSWLEVLAKKPGANTLKALAVIGAFGYSLFVLIATVLGLKKLGTSDFWWEFSALTTLLLAGMWLEIAANLRVQTAISKLSQLIPTVAEVIEGELAVKTSSYQLQVGQNVLVRTGYPIPVDGVIVRGQSSINEAMITGIGSPVSKRAGESVFAGSINAVSGKTPQVAYQVSLQEEAFDLPLGALIVTATAVGNQTVLGQVEHLTKLAQTSKNQTYLMAERVAQWLVYAVLAVAVFTALIWSTTGHQSPTFIVASVIAVLAIAAPASLGLAIPLVSAFSTISAAQKGVLIKNRLAFEQLPKVGTVLFDKTGTLTTQKRSFVSAHLTRRGGLENIDELLAVTAGLEQESQHSVASAILAETTARGITPVAVKDLMTIPGIGVAGRIDEFRLQAGGPAILTKNRIDVDVQDLYAADAANSAGNTVVYVLRDDTWLGFIAVGDEIRQTSADAVWELHQLEKKVGILTGDAHEVAKAVASKLAIDEVYAEVLPANKAQAVAQLQAAGRTLAMVGDGVSDSAALQQAEVGLAIGAGIDVNPETADVVLLTSDPEQVAVAIKLAKRSQLKVVQSIWWAAAFNLVAIPLAAGVLQPVGFTISPIFGAIVVAVSNLILIWNANLARGQKL